MQTLKDLKAGDILDHPHCGKIQIDEVFSNVHNEIDNFTTISKLINL